MANITNDTRLVTPRARFDRAAILRAAWLAAQERARVASAWTFANGQWSRMVRSSREFFAAELKAAWLKANAQRESDLRRAAECFATGAMEALTGYPETFVFTGEKPRGLSTYDVITAWQAAVFAAKRQCRRDTLASFAARAAGHNAPIRFRLAA